jgi:hypothetical protein
MALPATSRMVIFFLFVCFDRSTSTGGGKPRGGVLGSRRRRRSARWGGFNPPAAEGEPRGGAAPGPRWWRITARWGGFKISAAEANHGWGRRRRIRAATNRRSVQFLSASVDCISTGIFHTENESIRMYAFRPGGGGLGGHFFRLICVLVGN